MTLISEMQRRQKAWRRDQVTTGVILADVLRWRGQVTTKSAQVYLDTALAALVGAATATKATTKPSPMTPEQKRIAVGLLHTMARAMRRMAQQPNDAEQQRIGGYLKELLSLPLPIVVKAPLREFNGIFRDAQRLRKKDPVRVARGYAQVADETDDLARALEGFLTTTPTQSAVRSVGLAIAALLFEPEAETPTKRLV